MTWMNVFLFMYMEKKKRSDTEVWTVKTSSVLVKAGKVSVGGLSVSTFIFIFIFLSFIFFILFLTEPFTS